jgi:hypothetical protein
MYIKQNWEDLPGITTPVSAARLAHMEDGIAGGVLADSFIYGLCNSPGAMAGGGMVIDTWRDINGIYPVDLAGTLGQMGLELATGGGGRQIIQATVPGIFAFTVTATKNATPSLVSLGKVWVDGNGQVFDTASQSVSCTVPIDAGGTYWTGYFSWVDTMKTGDWVSLSQLSGDGTIPAADFVTMSINRIR